MCIRDRETKEQKGTGGGRTGYGKREVVTPLFPPIFLLSLLNVALNKSDEDCATLCVVVWMSLFSSLIFKRYLPVKLVSGSSELV